MYGIYADKLQKILNEPKREQRYQRPASIEAGMLQAGGEGIAVKNFASGNEWLTGFFRYGAQSVVDMYADEFVWEDIEFELTITDKEELFKFFSVFDDAGPDSPYGVHEFDLISYDGCKVPLQRATLRKEGVAKGWEPAEYHRLVNGIAEGADLEYDEWGYMQWVWRAQHNGDFFGVPAAGKTTVTRGTSTQFYRNGKIVRCRTHWNFREFAMQLGLIPSLDQL